MIINSQKTVYDKAGLGYNTLRKQKSFKNIFINESTKNLSNISYLRCGMVGHKAYTCSSNKFNGRKVKKIWVPKEIIMTNPKGPKLAWVPKVKI